MSPTIQSAIAVALDEDFDKKYEIVDGLPEANEIGSSLHGGVSARLTIQMGSYVEARKLGAVYGPCTTYQIGDNERMPDVSFLSAARIPEEGETSKKWPLAPDLAVEVISPNETWEKVNRKVQDYFAAGLKAVWLLSPGLREVHVYESAKTMKSLSEDEDLTHDALLPGFRCRVSDLFKQPVRA